MATKSGFSWTESWEAGANLSTKQFYFMKDDGTGKAIVCNNLTDIPIGVLENKPDASGKTAEILRFGRGKVSADASASIADFIGPSGDGQAIARPLGSAPTHFIAGAYREAPGATGDIVEADINCVAPPRSPEID